MPDDVTLGQGTKRIPMVVDTVEIDWQEFVEDPALEQPPTPPWSPRYGALTACRRAFRRHAFHGDPDA